MHLSSPPPLYLCLSSPIPTLLEQYEGSFSKVLQMQKPKQNYITLNQLTAYSLHNDYI